MRFKMTIQTITKPKEGSRGEPEEAKEIQSHQSQVSKHKREQGTKNEILSPHVRGPVHD